MADAREQEYRFAKLNQAAVVEDSAPVRAAIGMMQGKGGRPFVVRRCRQGAAGGIQPVEISFDLSQRHA